MSEDSLRTVPSEFLILYTTFMNEADMSDTQRAAINKEHFETWKRCMEDLQNTYGKANSGTIL